MYNLHKKEMNRIKELVDKGVINKKVAMRTFKEYLDLHFGRKIVINSLVRYR